MTSISKIVLLLNTERHHERERRNNPSLAAAAGGGGYVVKKGVLFNVILPLVDGATVAYLAHPVAGVEFVKPSHVVAGVADVVAIAAQ